MFVAIDDTDSRTGGCTTFLATEIIRELDDLHIIGYPNLVRLNPAVPWKTRGNAALVMEFGGTDGMRKIGEVGRDIISGVAANDDIDSIELMERIIPIVTGNREPDSETGLIVSSMRPRPELYAMGVRTILSKDIVDDELKRIGAECFSAGSGMGLVGAACSLAWIPGDSTFELLAYRHRDKWGSERYVDPETIREMDMRFETTFNSWEERHRKVTMVPSTPCPILYGIRGDDAGDLITANSIIRSEPAERWIVFQTNQGTDDHIIRDAAELIPDRSYSIDGAVTGAASHIKGGHVLIPVSTKYGDVMCAAYEPSKEFRMVFDNLVPGDDVTVMGELRDDPRTLNVEKIHVTKLADDIDTSNPPCPSCGKNMKSSGKGQGYRCKACGTKAAEQVKTPKRRNIVEGWYEPPAAARRHLSKPLKRMGIEQPIEFVNRRMV